MKYYGSGDPGGDILLLIITSKPVRVANHLNIQLQNELSSLIFSNKIKSIWIKNQNEDSLKKHSD